MAGLVLYEAAERAFAGARVDEVMAIHDRAAAVHEDARRAKNPTSSTTLQISARAPKGEGRARAWR
jgi:hypothetical protein